MSVSCLTACRTALAALFTTSALHAQSFNIDVGGPLAPGTAFVAAGTPGTWNTFAGPASTSLALTDVAGAATSVTIGIGSDPFTPLSSSANLGGATAEVVALMSDVLVANGVSLTWTISNLAAGEYDVFTYAMAPHTAAWTTFVSVAGSIHPMQAVGGVWGGSFVLGGTHARHTVSVAPAATIVITTGSVTDSAVNGFQIVKRPPANPGGVAFCTNGSRGVDHTTVCPCNNNGAVGNGCRHSQNGGGANLSATGTVTSDDVVLHAQFAPATSFTLFLQHDSTGDAVFHDGVLCASGALVRLRGRGAVAGETFFPDNTFAQDSTTTLSQRGGVTVGSGARRYYSAWYRNAATSFCPPATANVTNGWSLDW